MDKHDPRKAGNPALTKFVAGTLLAASAAFPLSAQEKDEDEVFTLSPFTVNAQEDQGYRASSTLAGTRIKSDLKDVGSSIQVLTKEFLEDIGAEDAQDLLLYTTNTEVGGASGNYSGEDTSGINLNTASSRANPMGATRVRGLFRATNTRNYFKTLIPFDSYNTGRVGINRGSNSILFGLGSPAGIVNNSLQEASWRDRTTLDLRVDNEGTVRSSLNVNKVLIDDKLAIRVAGLNDEREYYQRPTYQDTTRWYGAATWKIAESSSFRANYEKGYSRANRPDSMSPIDSISPWFDHGKPIYDSSLATGAGYPRDAQGNYLPTGISVNGVPIGPEQILNGETNAILQNPDGSFVFDGLWGLNKDGFLTAPKMANPYADQGSNVGDTNGIGGTNPQLVTVWDQPGLATPATPGFLYDYNNVGGLAGDAGSLYLGGDGQAGIREWKRTNNLTSYYNGWPYTKQGYTNLDGFDWGRNMLAGNTASQTQDFEGYNFALDKTFLNQTLGFEIAYDYQQSERSSYTPLTHKSTEMHVDINQRLPDGRENPNFGRPYVVARSGRGSWQDEMEAVRATAFYRLDFTEKSDTLGRWLGRHNFTAAYDDHTYNARKWGNGQVYDSAYLRSIGGAGGQLDHFATAVINHVYVGDSLLGNDVQSITDVNVRPIEGISLWNAGLDVPAVYYDPDTDSMVSVDVPIVQSFGTGGDYDSTNTKSLAGVWQGFFLADHLVTTFGYREDEVEALEYRDPPKDAVTLESDPFAPIADWDSFQVFGGKESQTSFGAVLHVPESWTKELGMRASLHHAESSNFDLQPRVNYANVELANPAGETREYGVSFSSLKNKMHLRVNWFETSVIGRSNNSLSGLTWNAILQSAKGHAQKYNAALYPKNLKGAKTTDPDQLLWADFYKTAFESLVETPTEGEMSRYSLENTYSPTNGELNGYLYNLINKESDTEDVVSKGVEFEATLNPTDNWRLHFNLARQQTVKTNVQPHSGEMVADRLAAYEQSLPAPFDFIKVGDMPKGGWKANQVDIPASVAAGELVVLKNYNSGRNFLKGKLVNYNTQKALEGSAAPEQREWRFNFVTSYSFKEGSLKGLSVGGGYRWQDEIGIGYRFVYDEALEIPVADIENPIMAPSEDAVDFFVNYRMPWLKEHGKWTVGARVRNAFAGHDDLVPVKVQPDGLTIARVRLAPQRLWSLSSRFEF